MDTVNKDIDKERKEQTFNVCIEIGSSRVKIGIQDLLTSDFKFIYQETKFFFHPIEELFSKLSKSLKENGVEVIRKIAISTTGEVDIQKGTIQSCGTLKNIAKLKSFKDFELVTLINTKLEQKILDKDFTYLINDGHSAGLGIYHYVKKTATYPYIVLSLGTFPAIAVITDHSIITVDSRKNFINGKHISQYSAKQLVIRDKMTDIEYSNNILQLIPLLQKICLNMTGVEMVHLFILGGMSNHIEDETFFKEESIQKLVTIIRDDKIVYSKIIFPGLLESNLSKDPSLKLVYKEDFSVVIN